MNRPWKVVIGRGLTRIHDPAQCHVLRFRSTCARVAHQQSTEVEVPVAGEVGVATSKFIQV